MNLSLASALKLNEPEIFNFETALRPHLAKIRTFRPKAFFQIQCGPYTVETITSHEDLVRIIELRHHSFVEDFAMAAPANWVDTDQYDLLADHVIVKHVDSKEILGTYRIVCSEFSDRFYSQEQFEIQKLRELPEVKIELGRACIHREHRNGVTLNLIWKGLARYATVVNARYMFGCASVKTVSPELAYSMFWHLYPFYFKDTLRSAVLPNYNCPKPTGIDSLPTWREVEASIPPLLRSYLQAGAYISSEPALDALFGCVDFLTALDLKEINPKYHRRYF